MTNVIDDAVRSDIRHSVLCWLATVGEDGTPNVSPKEIFDTHGDTKSVIANIASPRSVRNILIHPKVCVSFVDIFRERGFKITGAARVVNDRSNGFDDLSRDLVKKAGPNFPFRSIIAVEIERISRIWAPSYKLLPDRSEDDRMQSAYTTYGVRPV